MDPQKRFLASTLQGAIDADVLTNEDLFRHMSAEVLAEHLPSDLLWSVLVDGMKRAGIGFDAETAPATSAAEEPPPDQPEPPAQEKPPAQATQADAAEAAAPSTEASDSNFEVDEGDVAAMFQEVDSSGALDADLSFEISDEDMPPLPDGDSVVVEDVKWDEEEKES